MVKIVRRQKTFIILHHHMEKSERGNGGSRYVFVKKSHSLFLRVNNMNKAKLIFP